MNTPRILRGQILWNSYYPIVFGMLRLNTCCKKPKDPMMMLIRMNTKFYEVTSTSLHNLLIDLLESRITDTNLKFSQKSNTFGLLSLKLDKILILSAIRLLKLESKWKWLPEEEIFKIVNFFQIFGTHLYTTVDDKWLHIKSNWKIKSSKFWQQFRLLWGW